jgi:hypothetical protein
LASATFVAEAKESYERNLCHVADAVAAGVFR